jgi:sterol desaturase/sphingolipid hydroxylase (fatty acid hydroxylase superfamily)
MSSRKVPGWLSGALVLGAFGALVWLERRRPLRAEREPGLTRAARNLAVAAAGAAALRLAEGPVTDRLTALVERRRWGLLKLAHLPLWLEAAAGCVLLDYTLYLWHVLTHRAPFLWRFHVVHHADLDLDATTALRFHFAELALSVPWRAAQIVLIGVSPRTLSLWQTLLLLSILFHHSNVRLPVRVERGLNHLLVTPRMHGIHHSVVRAETDSNWSSGLTLWDRLHGTLRLDVPQAEVVIGVPAYRDPRELGLADMLAMPFGPERPTWRLNGVGPEPTRAPLAGSSNQLVA